MKEEYKKKSLGEIRRALVSRAWNINHSKRNSAPLLVVYPNEVIHELFGDEVSVKYWIKDNINRDRINLQK